MKKSKKGSTIFTAIASLLIFYLCNRVALVYENIPTGNFLEKTNEAIDMIIPAITAQPFVIGLTKAPLVSGAIGVVLIWLIYLYAIFGAKNYMFGVEHGSATWGTPQDIANYVDKDADNNILFTETEKLSMSDRMKRTETDDFNRNKNVLIIGGSGSGKTRFYIKPNLMQLHSSYVITDPKGSLIHETGKMLSDAGYKIKVFDLINRDKSDLYNPFEYSEQVEAAYKAIEAAIYGTWQGTYDEYISENTVYWQFVFNRDGTYSFNDDSGNNETGTFVLGRNTGEASYISNMTLTPKDRKAYTLNFTMTGNPINGLRFDSYGAERSYPTFVKK